MNENDSDNHTTAAIYFPSLLRLLLIAIHSYYVLSSLCLLCIRVMLALLARRVLRTLLTLRFLPVLLAVMSLIYISLLASDLPPT